MSQLRRILDALPILAARLRGRGALFAARARTRSASEPENRDAVVLTTVEAEGLAWDDFALADELDALVREGPGDQDRVA